MAHTNEALYQAFKKRGASFKKLQSDEVHLRLPFAQAMLGLESNEFASAARIAKNRDSSVSHLKAQGTKWTGGSYEDMIDGFRGKLDMKKYESALKEFERGDAAKLLRDRVNALLPKRKMRFSEEAGDFEYSRRNDDKPLLEIFKARSPSKIVEVCANFSFSASAEQRDIDRFGVYVWALTRLIEANGYQARIAIILDAYGSFGSGPKGNKLRLEYVLKEPGQYLAPSYLAAAFRCVFFRRAILSMIPLASDLVGHEVSYGLGSPVHQNQAVLVKDGALWLSGEAQTGATEKVIEALTKSFSK